MLLRHFARVPCSLALLNAGSSRLARMAMIAITTSSSISVNARWPSPQNDRGEVKRGGGFFEAEFTGRRWLYGIDLEIRGKTEKTAVCVYKRIWSIVAV